jgi:hypothetical protein
MTGVVLEITVACPVCREISARSELYERWLHAENFGDTATLEATAMARGFCSNHARRMLDRDPEVAAPIARFVLRAISGTLRLQLQERRRYSDALEPRALCPWCRSERDALEYAVRDKKHRHAKLCPPHARIAFVAQARHALTAEAPFQAGTPLDPPTSRSAQRPTATWWSPAIGVLWEQLCSSCPPCDTAREAGRRRETFLRAGPRPNEHWDVPVLCVEHYVALGAPDDSTYNEPPDAIPRPCDWCLAMEHGADRTAELFAIAYRDANFRLAYASVSGCCLPHAASVARRLEGTALQEFLAATSARIDAAEWELEERARRRAWQMRDQGAFAGAADVAHRAWWLIAGGVKRAEQGRVK